MKPALNGLGGGTGGGVTACGLGCPSSSPLTQALLGLRSGEIPSSAAAGSGAMAGIASVSDAAGPGAGFLPSLNAFAISAAFHFEYRIFSSTLVQRVNRNNGPMNKPNQYIRCLKVEYLRKYGELQGNWPQLEISLRSL